MNRDTFCAAPWFQHRITTNGQLKSCCVMQPEKTEFTGKHDYTYPHNTTTEWHNSDYIKYVRESLHNGVKIPECDKCWAIEKSNKKNSLRQNINDYFSGNSMGIDWYSVYFKDKKDYNSDLLLSADIQFDNNCNFACIMCNPHDSSKIWNIWSKNKNNKFVKEVLDKDPDYLDNVKLIYREKNNYGLLQQILSKTPKFLKILGGEPLLDKNLLEILKSLPESKSKKINLIVVTNGSLSLIDFAKKLQHFKSIQFVVSLEGIGRVQDYLRRGSNWEVIKKNILDYKISSQDNVYITYTLQALSVFHLPDLLAWCNDENLLINFAVLYNPDYLSLSAIPDDLKEAIYNKMKHTNVRFSVDFDSEFSENDDIAKMVLSSNHDPELTKKLAEFIQWYDADNQWQSVLPEWKEYLL